jgi:tripartite-type tricarboxylate transporter receptor subunit TctC
MTNRRFFATTALALLAGLCPGRDAFAQSADAWPSRPVRLIAPGLPGAASDVFARALAERLAPVLKQQVLVDNRPGATGMIAAKAVLQAPADGYTLLYATGSTTVMVSALKADLGVDFAKDFVPVAATFFGGVVLAVNPQVPAKNLQELIALVKAKPDEYNTYASWGIGSNGHLTMEWLKAQTGMQMQHVPYKGIAPILTDMTNGTVRIGWVDLVGSLPFVQSGRIRAIAANGAVRTPQMPDLPTMGEQGFPFPGTGWQGVLAPKSTPPAIVNRLHAEINKILLLPEMKELTAKLNVEPPQARSIEQFRELLARDLEVWKKIVADARITAE